MNKTALAILVALSVLSPSAQAQEMTATRLYKLCAIEDPSCISLLRVYYDVALEMQRMVREDPQSVPDIGGMRFCPRKHTPTDEQIFVWWMEMFSQTARSGSTAFIIKGGRPMPATVFMTYVMQFAYHC